MFKRANRLAASKEILSIQRGRPFFSDSFVLKARPSRAGDWRCAVVVSTKVSKRAVVRNRIKRLIRESIGAIGGNQPIGNFDFIISAKKVYVGELRDCIKEVEYLLNKAKII